MTEELQIRIYGDAKKRTVIYLPGIHGDWTLVSSFRSALAGKVRFVEFTYPRTLLWSLDDYAAALEAKLLDHDICGGWLLAESFGSQIAWQLLANSFVKSKIGNGQRPAHLASSLATSTAFPSETRFFLPLGLILAGGFISYPGKWTVRFAQNFCRAVPFNWITQFLALYGAYAKFRHRHAPETLAGLNEFFERRTELDRQAVVHRLSLIRQNDPSVIAQTANLPIFCLSGLFDPIVPGFWVRHWLKRHCRSYAGGRVIARADHNVLGTAPKTAAEQVLKWIEQVS
jgi:pimeloyl-ACP methyl ester carboxylesterase